MSFSSVYQHVQHELAEVETEMQATVHSVIPKLQETAAYCLQARGKRIRPTLAILAAKLGQSERRQVVKAAAALELVHLGSLVHDDVVDEAEARRGQASINHRYGNQAAVLLGDFLFSRSLSLARQAGSAAVEVVADIISTLVEGEMEQLNRSFDPGLTQDDYWGRIRRKTAHFLAECCRLGSLYSDDNPLSPDDWHAYGLNLGLAFQVKDDLLDFMGSTETVGKPTKRDLQAGVYTLPVIHALEFSPRRKEIQLLITDPAEDSWNKVIGYLQEAGSFRFAEQRASELITEAKSRLAPLPEHDLKDALITLADLVINRVS